MDNYKRADCSCNCGSIYFLSFALAVFLLWVAPARFTCRLPAISAIGFTDLVDVPEGKGSAEEYALFLQWLEYHRRTGKYPSGELLLSSKSHPESTHSPQPSPQPSPSPSLSILSATSSSPSCSPLSSPSPSPRLPRLLVPSIKSEVSPTPAPPLSLPTSFPSSKPNLRLAPGTLVLRRRPSSDFFDAQDRQHHPTDGPFMLLRTHPFSPTTWQLDIPTGSKMPLWHPEISLVRWDEGIKEIRCTRETISGREVRVHTKGWGCEDDIWVKEDDDAWLQEAGDGLDYLSSL